MFWTENRYLKGTKEANGTKVAQASPSPTILGEQLESTIGNFQITKDEICQENGKPIVYLFGSESCPHCRWEKPIFEKVVAKFTDKIVVHNNIDKQADMEVFQKYSSINQGAIPFLVLGCRYVRVGSGEVAGEIEEEKNLTALICKLTGDQPEKICAEVKD
ncbi:MAG: hypothetical protein LiPW16_341 [Microgenomates group bacterium LiPW_16]|nr:MAG: hypothetical protein LiPW16_341 [Microgenomates group bacterium LiPW_16]